MNTIRHPSTQQRFREAAKRWNHLKRQHEATIARLWLGTMLTQFDADEIALLDADYLSEMDRRLLAAAKKEGR